MNWTDLLRRWLKPNWVAIVLSLALTGWVGWSSYQAWFDRPLPSSAISAHQFRLNSAELKTLNTKLDHYHHPTIAPSVSSTTFTLISS